MNAKKVKDYGIPFTWYYEVTPDKDNPQKYLLARRAMRSRLNLYALLTVVMALKWVLSPVARATFWQIRKK